LLVNFSSLQESSLSLSLFPREGRRRRRKGDGQRDEKRRAPFVGLPVCIDNNAHAKVQREQRKSKRKET
jgi:hypothetical protein